MSLTPRDPALGAARAPRRLRGQRQSHSAHRSARSRRRPLGDDDQRRRPMTRRGVAAVLVWAAAIGASAYWLARHLEVTTDLSAFLPAAATPAQSLLVGQLRDGVASRLIIIGIEGGDTAALANASRALAAELAADPRFVFVANGDASRLKREQELVFALALSAEPGDDAGSLHRRRAARGARRSACASSRRRWGRSSSQRLPPIPPARCCGSCRCSRGVRKPARCATG